MQAKPTLDQAISQAYPTQNGYTDPHKQDPSFKGSSNNWESLERLYQTHVQMFARYHALAQMLLVQDIQEHLADFNSTVNLMKGLSADVVMLKNKTDRIHNKHAGRVGYSDDVDENFEIIRIFQEYAELNDQHELLILPMFTQINEMVNIALINIQERNAKVAAETATQSIPA